MPMEYLVQTNKKQECRLVSLRVLYILRLIHFPGIYVLLIMFTIVIRLNIVQSEYIYIF